jgi:hypothetical protein
MPHEHSSTVVPITTQSLIYSTFCNVYKTSVGIPNVLLFESQIAPIIREASETLQCRYQNKASRFGGL